MIPVRLQLKNFLSYGPTLQTINFEPHHLICLSGKNGHGKSALLDAITWALWGQARKASGATKADPHLIHLGQYHMLVIFDFLFNGISYRVRREFTHAYGKSTAALDFGILDTQTGALVPLTTTAMKGTQEMIIETLGLNYDAFINTAFLRQGGSNEFSKKSSKERKEILAAILGLQHYDTLRSKALDMLKKLQEQRTVATLFSQKLEQEIVHTKQMIEQSNRHQAEWKLLHDHENLLIFLRTQLAQQEEELVKEQAQLENNVLLEKRQFVHFSQLKSDFIQKWHNARHNRTAHHMSLIQQLENDYKESTIRINQLHNECQLLIVLKEKIASLDQQKQMLIHKSMLGYETSKKRIEEQLHKEQFEHKVTQQTSEAIQQQRMQEEKLYAQQEAQLHSLQQEIKELEKNVSSFSTSYFEKQKNKYQAWLSRAKHLHLMAQQVTFNHTTNLVRCPFCQQELTQLHYQALAERYAQQQQNLEHQIQRLKIVLPHLKTILLKQQTQWQEVQNHESALAHARIAETQLAETLKNKRASRAKLHQDYDNSLTQLKYHAQEIEKLADQQTTLAQKHEQELKNNSELQKIEKQREEIELKITELNHQESDHQSALEHHEQLSKRYHEMVATIRTAICYEDQRDHLLQQLSIVQKIKKTIQPTKIVEQRIHALKQQRNFLEQYKKRYLNDLAVLQRTKELLLQEQGKIALNKERIQQLQQALTNEQKKIDDATQELDDFTLIATALGKDGIQALLIENAIPEIEQEANALLSQLTDNQTHLFIDSLRDLKRGGTKETLDIKISDAAGIRPYELFSGGEAFRIDFALRVAISKLLARRAGTSLQTLIIDEGFGSQDEEGLAHIMDALYRIQNNFCKIIIVSHLTTMKEQFPVHFVVQKNAQGSIVTTIQQG